MHGLVNWWPLWLVTCDHILSFSLEHVRYFDCIVLGTRGFRCWCLDGESQSLTFDNVWVRVLSQPNASMRVPSLTSSPYRTRKYKHLSMIPCLTYPWTCILSSSELITLKIQSVDSFRISVGWKKTDVMILPSTTKNLSYSNSYIKSYITHPLHNSPQTDWESMEMFSCRVDVCDCVISFTTGL